MANFLHLSFVIWHLTPDTWYSTLKTGHLTPESEDLALNIRCGRRWFHLSVFNYCNKSFPVLSKRILGKYSLNIIEGFEGLYITNNLQLIRFNVAQDGVKAITRGFKIFLQYCKPHYQLHLNWADPSTHPSGIEWFRINWAKVASRKPSVSVGWNKPKPCFPKLCLS